jgi:2-polyprenyl-6-methoxyphenol hydroxylase-like FAD-dependent oxidoreductase
MLERMKHGVIGAGPCGTLTALLLLEAGYKVVLFDVNDKSEPISGELKSNLKLMGESTSPYDLNQLIDLKINEWLATKGVV